MRTVFVAALAAIAAACSVKPEEVRWNFDETSQHQPFRTERERASLRQRSKLKFTFLASSEVGGGPTIDNIVVKARR
jgi:ABC-type hemin transport system ATPase subunit